MTPVELLRALLRVDTTNPPGNEGEAAEILRSYLDEAGLDTEIVTSPAGRPSLVARIEGPSDAPALVLLSHTDVVGVERERWSRDPFGGDISFGELWGRGALDMKGISAMHAAAAAAVARSGSERRREVIVVAVADEEAGGAEGAGWLCSEHADRLGFAPGRPPPEALGEGAFGLSGILDDPLMPIVLGEKSALWLQLRSVGQPGHGALPPVKQAPVNLARAVDRIAGFGRPRVHPVMKRQFEILAGRSKPPNNLVFRALGSGAADVVARALAAPIRARGTIATLLSDTATPTQITAGYKHNVVPGEATGALDCRLLPDTDPTRFAAELRKRVADLDVTVEVIATHGGPVSEPRPLYTILEQESARLPSNPVVVPSLTAGITDLRHFRKLGATGYGWVPLVLSPEQLATIHGHDERIVIEDLERAVVAMTSVVTQAALQVEG